MSLQLTLYLMACSSLSPASYYPPLSALVTTGLFFLPDSLLLFSYIHYFVIFYHLLSFISYSYFSVREFVKILIKVIIDVAVRREQSLRIKRAEPQVLGSKEKLVSSWFWAADPNLSRFHPRAWRDP